MRCIHKRYEWHEMNETKRWCLLKSTHQNEQKEVSCHHCTTHINTVTHSSKVHNLAPIFCSFFHFMSSDRLYFPAFHYRMYNAQNLWIKKAVHRSWKRFIFSISPSTIWWFGLKDNVLYLFFFVVSGFRKSNRERSGDFDSKKPWICSEQFWKPVNFVYACTDSNRQIECSVFGVRYHRITNIWFISSNVVFGFSLFLSFTEF